MAGAFNAPPLSIGNAAIEAVADIEASKLIHQFQKVYNQNGTVVAENAVLHVARAAGQIMDVEATITGAIATGGDRTITIDIKKSTGGGAFTTILSGTIGFTNGSVLNAITTGSVSAAPFIDGDIIKAFVTVAGSASAQAVGLSIALTVWEKAQ